MTGRDGHQNTAKPLVRTICFIDDDADNRRQWMEWAEMHGITANAFESAFEANNYSADLYVFDISAVSQMCVGHHAYSPICRLWEDHPGADVVIGSCMSRNYVEDVLDDVEKVAGRRPAFFDMARGFAGLEEYLSSNKEGQHRE
jgi:hypothetical protein